MPEKEINVKPMKLLYKCDKCKDGYLSYFGQTSEGIDGKKLYTHECTKCKKLYKMKKQYPSLKLIEIKDKIEPEEKP